MNNQRRHKWRCVNFLCTEVECERCGTRVGRSQARRGVGACRGDLS